MHNNFSYPWQFEPDIPNIFGEILFEKPPKFTKTVWAKNVLPPSNFAVFSWTDEARRAKYISRILKLFYYLLLFLFLHFTCRVRASNVVKTWCLILQVVQVNWCYFLCYWLQGAETYTNCINQPALSSFKRALF